MESFNKWKGKNESGELVVSHYLKVKIMFLAGSWMQICLFFWRFPSSEVLYVDIMQW